MTVDITTVVKTDVNKRMTTYKPGLFILEVWMTRSKTMPKKVLCGKLFHFLSTNTYQFLIMKTAGTGL